MAEAFLRDVVGRSCKGNARELRSFLEVAVVLGEAGILDVPEVRPRASQAEMSPGTDAREFVPLHAMVEAIERRHIRSALERSGGSVMKAAELLGVSRKTPWEEMKKLKVANVTAHEDGRN